jgi:hypothetical protein
MTTTMREALDQAMHHSGDGDPVSRLADSGLAVANVDTMSQAIHDVYCGIMADHEHPNEKDRQQAAAMIAALQRVSATQPS